MRKCVNRRGERGTVGKQRGGCHREARASTPKIKRYQVKNVVGWMQKRVCRKKVGRLAMVDAGWFKDGQCLMEPGRR